MLKNALRYEPWAFNDIAGTPLVSPIIDGIDESQFVVADITYLNPNVVYEIGFAIGRSKRAFLVCHSEIDGDRRVALDVGIFDTLGYETFNSDDRLSEILTAYVDKKPLAFSPDLDRRAPVYVVEPPNKGGAATVMTSRLKKSGYKYRSFNPTEESRLSATDAIRQVAASGGILVSIIGDNDTSALVHDTRSLFVAGLAHGMGKPTLILAPSSVHLPLDIRDAAWTFSRPEDIAEGIARLALQITEYLQQADPIPLEHATPIQVLQIGAPTAENEMTTLAGYFLKTDQYTRARRGDANLVVGRKGAGKTALFIQLRDQIRADKRNVVVDLKPEGYQLIKLKEDILAHLTQGASHHLVTAFWEYLLLLEITYKLLEKDKQLHKFNHEIRDLYIELERTYRVEDFSTEGDFAERLMSLSQRIAQDYRSHFGSADSTKLTTEQVTELVYSHDLRKLRQQVSEYLEHKESVWVLFDNLDKGWSTQGVDAVDAMVLRCLIDAGRKIERDMRKDGHDVHCVVFIRNDVYEHLMRQSADYGKEMRVTLDWTDPDMLRELLRLRLVAGLDLQQEDISFDQIWPRLCVSHYRGAETSAYIIERALMRPRNVIKIISHAKGFAANLNHQKIEESDLEKGIRAYSQDLIVELDHELTDVFPAAEELLYHFIDCPHELTEWQLHDILLGAEINEGDIARVKEFLLYYGIVGVKGFGTETHYIFDVNYDLKVLLIRAARNGDATRFVVNPAFRPALGISDKD
ncbi:MAG: hypothetical protein H6943_07780 [Zoogloeaceae bacterium]|nr:hypothetical protein [Zoogloeaceae bacterium]